MVFRGGVEFFGEGREGLADFGVVDEKAEAEVEVGGGALAEFHTVEENLKIVEHGADRGIEGEGEDDLGLVVGQVELAIGNGIVDAVVDIEGLDLVVAHTAAAHVAFVGYDKRGGDFADRECCAFIVVANSGDNLGDVLARHTHLVQKTEGHHGAGLGVVDSVDDIADVVHVACDTGELYGMG